MTSLSSEKNFLDYVNDTQVIYKDVRVYDKEGNEFMINSRHHQHCKELGKGLEKILWAYDDTIEAAIGEKVVLVQL